MKLDLLLSNMVNLDSDVDFPIIDTLRTIIKLKGQEVSNIAVYRQVKTIFEE